MNKHIESIILALMAVIGCLVLFAAFTTAVQCSADGGTTVRGLIWLECIK